jgi:hypothetical protein
MYLIRSVLFFSDAFIAGYIPRWSSYQLQNKNQLFVHAINSKHVTPKTLFLCF